MKAKYRMLWMKLHAYFACFFLPITLVYIITGMLYFFDIEGEVTAEIEYPVQLSMVGQQMSSKQNRLYLGP